MQLCDICKTDFAVMEIPIQLSSSGSGKMDKGVVEDDVKRLHVCLLCRRRLRVHRRAEVNAAVAEWKKTKGGSR